MSKEMDLPRENKGSKIKQAANETLFCIGLLMEHILFYLYLSNYWNILTFFFYVHVLEHIATDYGDRHFVLIFELLNK